MSGALLSLEAAVAEIDDLYRAKASAASALHEKLQIDRAVGRAQVVLLSSHFERYIYAVNEEATAFLNARAVSSLVYLPTLRLVHSKQPIDDLATASWENRQDRLEQFVLSDAWLWSANAQGSLVPGRLLAWMKTPKPQNLVRYYRYWGIPDVFTAVTRTPQTRNRLWLGVQELVDKRNNIAHGDYLAQATQVDVRRYLSSVITFCERADRRFAIQLGRLAAVQRPW